MYWALDGQLARRQPQRQKCRLPQLPRELPLAQGKRYVLRLVGCGHELPARFEQCLNLGFVERPAIQTHVVQFAAKRLCALNASEMEIHARIVQVRRTNRSLGDDVAVDIQPRLPLAASHHGRDMLPGVVANLAAPRGHRAIRLIVGSEGFEPQGALCYRAYPSTSRASRCIFPGTPGPLACRCRGMDPRRHGEVAVADVHRLVTTNYHRVAIKRHGLAKG